ncbi:MAG: hypothetical protein ACREE6_05670 [Limisphaerales bacterium]
MKIPLLLLLVSISRLAFAQSSAHFAITREVIAGGGATSGTNTNFRLDGTIGQPVPVVPAGGRFSIQSGFWIRPAPILFAPTAANGNFMVSVQAELGESYTVSYANSLTRQSWQTLTNFTGKGGITTVTNAAAGANSRFYRLTQQ